MALNAQQKGKEGEREIARDLNAIVDNCLRELGQPLQDPSKPRVQRNQNQSAVGGCDLSGTFELAIEIKRQEALSINTWWHQCVDSANKLRHRPVLIFRQNTPGGGRKYWRVIKFVDVPIPGCDALQCRAEISYEDFKLFFKRWALEHLRSELQLSPRQVIELPATETPVETPETAPTRQRLPDLYA